MTKLGRPFTTAPRTKGTKRQVLSISVPREALAALRKRSARTKTSISLLLAPAIKRLCKA